MQTERGDEQGRRAVRSDRRPSRVLLGVACVATSTFGQPLRAARAQPRTLEVQAPNPPTSVVRSSNPGPVALVVDLRPDSSVDAEGLRADIARELGVTVVSGAKAPGGTLLVRERENDVVVSFESPDGRTELRDLELPADANQAEHDIALVAANLARDQSAPFVRPLPSPSSAESGAPTSAAATAQPQLPAPSKTETAAPGPNTRTAPVVAAAPTACERPGPFAEFGFDLVPFVGTSRRRHVSVGLVGTLSDGVHGIAAGSAFNVDTAFVCGAELAGAFNVASGPVSGLQAAGSFNVAAANLRGAQLAGAVNVAAGPMTGLQGAGALNFALDTEGAELAGAGNVTRSLHGAQLAGAFNVATTVRGAQLAGGLNVATGVHGAQLAPINVAAGPVHGVQIGVINVATQADFALGVISVATRGRFQVDAWGLPEAGLLLAGVKNGGPHYHYIYAIGVRPADARRVWAAAGLGAHLTPLQSVFVDIDAIAHTELVFESNPRSAIYQGRLLVGYQIVPGFAVFGGPSYNVLEAALDAPRVAPGYSTNLAQNSTELFRGWPGVVIGVEGL